MEKQTVKSHNGNQFLCEQLMILSDRAKVLAHSLDDNGFALTSADKELAKVAMLKLIKDQQAEIRFMFLSGAPKDLINNAIAHMQETMFLFVD